MTTTFDRYLLVRFLHVFFVAFVATLGLYVIIDGFTNVDGFQEAVGDGGTMALLLSMGSYYGYQSSLFLELVGPMLTIIAAMVVFAILQKQGEIHPILAAGIPIWRLAVPVVGGTLLINGVLSLNQELVIPSIADKLQAQRGSDAETGQRVTSALDFRSNIVIDGEELLPAESKIVGAEFILPVYEVTETLTTLRAREAYFHRETSETPSGWLLKGVNLTYDQLALTPTGKKIIGRLENPDELFVVTDISFDELHERTSYRYLSTAELIRRIRNPSLGLVSVRKQSIHLHWRLTRPLMCVIAVLLAIPYIVRKEGTGLVSNMAVCTLVMGGLYGADQVFLYAGSASYLSPDLAAWSSLIFAGTLCAWSSSLVRT